MTADSNPPVGNSTESGELGFEDAFRQLAEIAEKLEAGGLTLAEATAQYEQGMRLVQRCNHLLDSAELEITTLRESYQRPGGTVPVADVEEAAFFDEEPFEDDSDEEELPF